MFGKDNATNGSKKDTGTKTSVASAGGHSLNSIVKGTAIEGTIKANSDIRVDGTIKGKLYCDSKVIIGPTGRVEGEVRCQNAVIEGKFEGVLEVKELLNIRETATVDGDVTTGKLIIQPGGIFNVTCKMGSGAKQTLSSNSQSSQPKNQNQKTEKVA